VGGRLGEGGFAGRARGVPPGLAVCGGDNSQNGFGKTVASTGMVSILLSLMPYTSPILGPYSHGFLPTTEKEKELALAREVSFLLQLRGRVHALPITGQEAIKRRTKKNISTISNTSPIRVNCL
jgi:hypothetical protein